MASYHALVAILQVLHTNQRIFIAITSHDFNMKLPVYPCHDPCVISSDAVSPRGKNPQTFFQPRCEKLTDLQFKRFCQKTMMGWRVQYLGGSLPDIQRHRTTPIDNLCRTIGAATDIIVSNASLTVVNGIYRKCGNHDGVSMYYKLGLLPSPEMVYAIFRAPIDVDDARAAGRRWYLGKVPHRRCKIDSTIEVEELYYCTAAPVGLSEEELLTGDQSDWNIPVSYEWRAITHDDDCANETPRDYGVPPVVKVRLVDLTTENTEDTAIDRINIEERLLNLRRFENRALMMALFQTGRMRLHFQKDMMEKCTVCLEPLKNDHRKGVAVAEIGACKHNFHTICLEQCLNFDFKCPICRGII